MPMTALPAAPSTSSPSDFAAKADALLAALPGFVTEANALETAVDADKTAAAGSASAASDDADATAADRVQTGLDRAAAVAAAAAAAGSASTSAGWSATSTTSMTPSAAQKTITVQTGKQFTAGTNIKVFRTSAPTTTYAFAAVDSYNTGNGQLVFTIAAGEFATPGGPYTDWTVQLSGGKGATGATGTGVTNQAVGFTATGGTSPKTLTVDEDVTVSDLFSKITRDPRPSNTKLVAADKGQLIDVTTASFTQTFDPAATLGAGWFVYILNSSATDLTLDADGTETFGAVNAATTAVLKPGQGTIVTSNGSNLYFADQPTGFRNMEVFTSSGTFTPKPGVVRYFVKAVGGGGSGYGVGGSAYGGSGGSGGYAEGFVNITSPQTVTVGAAGYGYAGAPTAGGTTSVGAIITCTGGGAGGSASAGTGGTASMTGGVLVPGGAGCVAGTGTNSAQGPGTPLGNGPLIGSATGYGAGGAGQQYSGTGGGDGAPGLVIFMW